MAAAKEKVDSNPAERVEKIDSVEAAIAYTHETE